MLLQRRRDVGAPQRQTSRLLPVMMTVTDPQVLKATLPSMPRTPEVAVEIEVGGAVERVREGASQHTLRQVIAALRGPVSGAQP